MDKVNINGIMASPDPVKVEFRMGMSIREAIEMVIRVTTELTERIDILEGYLDEVYELMDESAKLSYDLTQALYEEKKKKEI